MSFWLGLLIVLGFIGGCSGTPESPTPATSEVPKPTTGASPNVGTPERGTIKILRAGDPVPSAVIAGARHWQREGAAGSRILIVSFGSTRCPAEAGCGITERKLRLVHEQLRKEPSLKSSIGLLTVSVDPTYDVPAVLRAHADRVGADAELWRFTSLPATQIDAMLGPFGAARDAGVVAIVDADGKLVKVYGDRQWTPDDLARDIQSLVLRAEPAVVAAYIDAQEALARDDVRGARRALTQLTTTVTQPAVQRLANAAATATNIGTMRAAFKPLSEVFGRLPWPRDYQPMYCPMFEGNAGATWVQKAGPALNPYYGKTMLRCGSDMSAGAHDDHSPKYGGMLFMAADQFHHIEGTYTAGGLFRAYVYDNFKQPMTVTSFQAVLEAGGRTIRLTPSADRLTLVGRVGSLPLPTEMVLKVKFGRGGDEERFDFIFASFSPPAS